MLKHISHFLKVRRIKGKKMAHYHFSIQDEPKVALCNMSLQRLKHTILSIKEINRIKPRVVCKACKRIYEKKKGKL
jgi:hypothetical protein